MYILCIYILSIRMIFLINKPRRLFSFIYGKNDKDDKNKHAVVVIIAFHVNRYNVRSILLLLTSRKSVSV